MKAAEIASRLRSQGRDAVRTTQERLIRESVALLRETGWRAVGEYNPKTGACWVVLRVPDTV